MLEQDGKDGAPGTNGIDGKDGAQGLPGKDGTPGTNGIDGKDGAPGEQGPPGPAVLGSGTFMGCSWSTGSDVAIPSGSPYVSVDLTHHHCIVTCPEGQHVVMELTSKADYSKESIISGYDGTQTTITTTERLSSNTLLDYQTALITCI